MTRFYGGFGFTEAGDTGRDKIMRRAKGSWASDEDDEEAACWCREWRKNAANWRYGKYTDGIDLSHFIVSGE